MSVLPPAPGIRERWMEGTLFKILGDRVELNGARVFSLGLSGSQGLSGTVKLCARVQIGGQRPNLACRCVLLGLNSVLSDF